MSITINKQPIKTFTFSGGEVHVSIMGGEFRAPFEIEAYLYSSDAVMRLIMTVDALKQSVVNAWIHLTIPYFPYARQDRVCNEGEAFGLEVMAKLINDLGCEKVTVVDPHSDVLKGLLHRCTIVRQADILAGSVADFRGLTLVAPDAGAKDKTTELAKCLGLDAMFCTKTRDSKTGEITGTNIPKGIVAGRDCVIVDDICDGGRTFIELAKALKADGVGELSLYITHGIFSKGLGVLREHFKHVYCYHSFNYGASDFLTILKETKYED